MDPYNDLRALLVKNRASLTKPRKKVFDLLSGHGPQTTQVLIKRAGDSVDRATIYRTLELFERLGIVHRLNIGWKYKYELSDIFLEHHHHFYCSNCGKNYDLPANAMLETMVDSLASKEGFSPRGHHLEIYGLCPACSGSAL